MLYKTTKYILSCQIKIIRTNSTLLDSGSDFQSIGPGTKRFTARALLPEGWQTDSVASRFAVAGLQCSDWSGRTGMFRDHPGRAGQELQADDGPVYQDYFRECRGVETSPARSFTGYREISSTRRPVSMAVELAMFASSSTVGDGIAQVPVAVRRCFPVQVQLWLMTKSERRNCHASQFSTRRSGTRRNLLSLLVTTVRLSERACAAMSRSLGPIGNPCCDSRWRMSP